MFKWIYCLSGAMFKGVAGSWIRAAGVFQRINPPFFPLHVRTESELRLKSVCLFVFIALTNLFI